MSTELYSSDAHFIYELIQNADDNFYSHAIENGQLPELVITLSNDRIVFENNENGFRRANVEAISQAATSTKQRTADQTFTGEKGIGFKACFKIADKVHIESNLYSFAFQFARHSALKGYSTISPLPEPYSRTSSYATCITLSQFYEFNFAELKR